ncbi:acid protease [Xylariaceae sp. FL0662B]|nr:acid protease [Xylariaceae sp. FL0662B]
MLLPTRALAILAPVSQLVLAVPTTEAVTPQPDRIVKSATGTLTGSVAATPTLGEYFGPIQVDGKTYSVLYDTGSNGLWIKRSPAVAGPAFSISYGSGTVSGNVTSGTVIVGGMTIQNQAYGVATSWSSSYNNYDGILGLAPYPTQFGSVKAPTWLSNIAPLLKQPLFAVNMVPGATSTYNFGYQDPSHEKSAPVYSTADVSTGLWYLNVSSFGVPSGVTSIHCDLDTGTTDVLVPLSVAQAYWGQVKGATTTDGQKWQFPCSSAVPDFVPTIGGVRFPVSGAYSVFNLGGGTCGSRLQGIPAGCILGQSFLYGYYAVYDYGNKSIGLSPRI